MIITQTNPTNKESKQLDNSIAKTPNSLAKKKEQNIVQTAPTNEQIKSGSSLWHLKYEAKEKTTRFTIVVTPKIIADFTGKNLNPIDVNVKYRVCNK